MRNINYHDFRIAPNFEGSTILHIGMYIIYSCILRQELIRNSIKTRCFFDFYQNQYIRNNLQLNSCFGFRFSNLITIKITENQ